MAAEALVVAIVGAESTGKTVLAQALAQRIAAETGLACCWVPEQLRLWCEQHGRTPQPHEQPAIAAAQQEAIEAAARMADVVVADTTALMTAVYSRLLFDDGSLDTQAADWQRRCALTLLTALDIEWVADGLQRDGPQVRAPVDALLRELLAAHALPWALVSGGGQERVENALDAIAPLLRCRTAPRSGLFTRLAGRDAADRPWRCEHCDDPQCEHAAQAARRA
ncbi:AAA family ATPase [Rubrivivax gelatinosus]|uniref:ATPase n=1 Tax=Rubrivivax gelatinosus TaxID=28068 RepID=A0ABS1DPE2_RUBGE|nr:ATP-binding protein [Rubrivivax gelatinosus]MBK1711445.1 ATPase [Rubrivivax gelatinosus]